MAKPLAGKRWFEALGRSDKSRGVPRSAKHYDWPAWAQQAYMRGRMLQGVNMAKAKPSNAQGQATGAGVCARSPGPEGSAAHYGGQNETD